MVKAYPFDSIVTYDGGQPVYDRPADSEMLRELHMAISAQGVIENAAGDSFNVVSSGYNTSVVVKAGKAIVQGVVAIEDEDTEIFLSEPTVADAYDTIVLRLDDTIDERRVYITKISGEGGFLPPVREGGIYDLAIAYVKTPLAGTGQIITDSRGDPNECGFAGAKVDEAQILEALSQYGTKRALGILHGEVDAPISSGSGSSATVDISFGRTFSAAPAVVVSARHNSNADLSAHVRNVTTTGCTVQATMGAASTGNVGVKIDWIAVGD